MCLYTMNVFNMYKIYWFKHLTNERHSEKCVKIYRHVCVWVDNIFSPSLCVCVCDIISPFHIRRHKSVLRCCLFIHIQYFQTLFKHRIHAYPKIWIHWCYYLRFDNEREEMKRHKERTTTKKRKKSHTWPIDFIAS